MKVQAAHTRLYVSDIATCAEFYRDILKFKPITVQIEKGYAEFEVTDNLRLSLFSQQEMAEILRTSGKSATADCQDKFGLVLIVHDIDDIYHELRHAGIAFAEPPTQNTEFSIKVAYLRDPAGNLIGLFEAMM
ncbi:MAG: VOC family protein [Phormidesmis sp.]